MWQKVAEWYDLQSTILVKSIKSLIFECFLQKYIVLTEAAFIWSKKNSNILKYNN